MELNAGYFTLITDWYLESAPLTNPKQRPDEWNDIFGTSRRSKKIYAKMK